jgi:hypothetical protein
MKKTGRGLLGYLASTKLRAREGSRMYVIGPRSPTSTRGRGSSTGFETGGGERSQLALASTQ